MEISYREVAELIKKFNLGHNLTIEQMELVEQWADDLRGQIKLEKKIKQQSK